MDKEEYEKQFAYLWERFPEEVRKCQCIVCQSIRLMAGNLEHSSALMMLGGASHEQTLATTQALSALGLADIGSEVPQPPVPEPQTDPRRSRC